MPKFNWEATDASGKLYNGVLEADSKGQVKQKLQENNLRAKKIHKISSAYKKAHFFNSLKVKDKLFLLQSLTILTKSGVPLLSGIVSLEKETKNKVIKEILGRMRETVVGGKPLHTVFEEYERYFNPLHVALIKSGETTGQLSTNLELVYEQMQKDYKLIHKVRSALIYPIILVIAVIGILSLMFFFVVPKLQETFSSTQVELHALTRFMFAVTDFINSNVWWIVLGFGFFVALLLFLQRLRVFHERMLIMILGIPILGPIYKNTQLVRFTRSIGATLSSGVAFPESVRLTADILSGEYKRKVLRFIPEIEKGQSLYSLLEKEEGLFPPTILQIVSVGEKTGRLPDVMLEIGEFYEKETDNAIQTLISLIEPLAIIIMGGIVGFITLSITVTIITSSVNF